MTKTIDSAQSGKARVRQIRSPAWHRRANHGTNGRRQAHRKSTPKHHPYGRSENFGAAGFRTDHPE
jgi:hypothetical protein